ncbi:uncharacterized protein [Montipora foliosa]|uniref:uncharacterized protein isoform X4 n=1 Tax=Montipora foliosa TaxID=591990 RepID=UPI0035F1E9F7
MSFATLFVFTAIYLPINFVLLSQVVIAADVGRSSSSLQATEWYRTTVNYWPFEDVSNQTATDYTGTNNGKIKGNHHVISGIVGSALALSGNNSFVDFGVLSSTCLREPSTCQTGFTIAFWIKIPEIQGNEIILQLAEHRYARGFTVWTRKRPKGKIGFSVNTRLRNYKWLQEWNSRDWNHIALIWNNASSSLKISVNCSIVQVVNSSEKAVEDHKKASRLILGASHAMKKNMKLMVDEFAIWDRPISGDTLCKIVKIQSVNGNYSEWSEFSACSVTCGNGTMKRTRTCTSPSPKDRGKNCAHLGASEQTKPCFLVLCPIHGNFSNWSSFSDCSKSCGTGFEKRTRNCSNPEPKHGGQNCTSLGLAVEVRSCNTQPCPINGGYSAWTDFTECTVSCGNGTRQRSRNCSNPQPRYGGQNCSFSGPNINIEICNMNLCPIHGGFSKWTKFSECTRSCGNGTRTRLRKCSNPQPKRGGRGCLGPDVDIQVCNTQGCPINGGYAPWTNFSECTKSCGNGTQKRTRNCSNPVPQYGGDNCSSLGRSKEVRQCNIHICPINGGYTAWTEFTVCSKSCGNGTQKRIRNCSNPAPQHGGKDCSSLGDSMEIKQCNSHHCPLNGGYTQWSDFTACSSTCGEGKKTRWRNCSNPLPQYGGRNCSHLGVPVHVEYCFLRHCPVHGGFTEWTQYGPCTRSCDVGLKNRTRYCTNPMPQHGGNDCSGEHITFKVCNTFSCPIDGGYTQWSQFSACSQTCESGTMRRTRKCNNPAPRSGGNNCSLLGPPEEVWTCNNFSCPVHGNYSTWSNFSSCSKSCGNGSMERQRNCSNPEPKHGGKDCSILGASKEIKSCNEFPCPIHASFSSWSIFSVCSKSCGNGTKTRTRNCSNPSPQHGGRNCSSLGPSEERNSCNVLPCPINGNYSPWSNFNRCSKSCGNGTKTRTRSCTNPKPQHNGTNCALLGPSTDVKPCNVFSCPVDGGYTEWGNFTQCSQSCDKGTMYRVRNCTNPAPKHGGKSCSEIGSAIDVQNCNEHPCPIDGLYSDWSQFSECSRSCAGGRQNRSRTCDNPSPKHGGMNCSRLGPASEVQTCNSFPCPVHGNYSEWSGYQKCDRACGGGMRTRRRTCTNPTPAHGGRNCSDLGPSAQTIACNIHDCPDIIFNVAVNLTSQKWNHKQEYSRSLSLKIQFGVKEILGIDVVSGVNNFSFKHGSVIAEFSVALVHRHYQGITKLQDAIYMEGKIHDLRVSPVNFTSPDVPVRSPINITATSRSSTTILLKWQSIPLDYSNGVILEYRITYIEKEGNGIVEKSGIRQKIIDGQDSAAYVTGLKKFTKYQFRMAGVNKRGVGVDSAPIIAMTNQDKPSKPPSPVTALNRSSTSILVKWSPIPKHSIHGMLLGYHIHFKSLDSVGLGIVSSRVQSTAANTTSSLIPGLLKFTDYSIQVSGFTVKGDGPLSKAVFVKTEEDVPSKAPLNVKASNLTSTSIQVEWEQIPRHFVHGNLLGYKVSFVATDRGNKQPWNETSVNQSTTTAVITNLRKYTTYMVSVEGFTSKGSGIESKCVAVTTAEDVPDAYPSNVTGFNKSSTSLYVEWSHIPQLHRNGVLKGYKITYTPIQYQPSKSVTVDSTRSSTTLVNLKKYTWYDIKVAGFTSKGLGPHPPNRIKIRTSEDVPSKPAISVNARNTSHTSLFVEWNAIPAEYIHGVLLGYRVVFWRYNESRDTYDTRQTGPDVLSVLLTDLWIYTKYKIQVLGFTSVGEGSISKEIEVSTDEFTPSQPPINVRAPNKTSPTKITVQWNPIPDNFYVHGILRGYKVFYTAIATANKKHDEVMETKEIILNSSTRFIVLKNLSVFTRYEIEVLAFTAKGDGVRSDAIRADTCNCRNTIFTNWWINPPYTDNQGSNKSGIITPILKQAVYTCCENCTEHGNSHIDFQHEYRGRPAIKSGLLEFKRNIEEITELHFPVYGTMDQRRYSGNYGFVPFVQSPGIALIIIGDEKGSAATLLLKSLAFCFPILFLSIAMLWVSSLIMWFLETAYNQGHFPHGILQGSWEAIWWAFASMTTLGYGDRIPRTPFGRLIGLSWILTGIVMITCFNSIMTTLLTARILDKDVMLYGTKIAAIQNSSSYRLAIRKNARVNPNGKEYANLQEVYEALQNREVKGMLIDAFTVGSKKELFNRRDLRISKLLDYSSAYGVALGGDAKKLQKCFQKYISEQRSDISKIVQDNVDAIEVTPQSLSVERSKSLFDPNFPTYVKTMIMCGVLLAVMLLVGAKFEFVKKMGWIKLKRKVKEDQILPRRLELKKNVAELKSEMSMVVSLFTINCSRLIHALQQKHKRELLHLAKLKRQTESVPIQKGSFRRDTLLKRSLGATKTQEHNSNGHGHTKQGSTRSRALAIEMETIV